MTALEWWTPLERDAVVFRVNGCLDARVSAADARDTDDYAGLVARRLFPLLAAAMPGHE